MSEQKEQKPKVDDSIKTIRLDAPTGAKRCGVFRRGVDYEVGKDYHGVTLTPEMATHLVTVKRFTKNPAPKAAPAAEKAEAPAADAGTSTKTGGKGKQ